MKERIIFQQRYTKHAMPLRDDLLDVVRLPYLAHDAIVRRLEIRSAGAVELDGKRLEFQDIRVYTEVPNGD